MGLGAGEGGDTSSWGLQKEPSPVTALVLPLNTRCGRLTSRALTVDVRCWKLPVRPLVTAASGGGCAGPCPCAITRGVVSNRHCAARVNVTTLANMEGYTRVRGAHRSSASVRIVQTPNRAQAETYWDPKPWPNAEATDVTGRSLGHRLGPLGMEDARDHAHGFRETPSHSEVWR